MRLSTNVKVVFTSPFPENCEIFLTFFISTGYRMYLNTYNVVYNKKEKQYNLQVSIKRQVFCAARILALVSQLYISISGSRFTRNLTIPGPIKVFTAATGAGSYCVGIVFLTVVNLPSFHRNVLQLVNLLSEERSRTKKVIRPLGWRNLVKKVVLHADLIFNGLTPFIFAVILSTKPIFSLGLKNQLKIGWEMYTGHHVEHFRDMSLWMKIVGSMVIFPQIDSNMMLATGMTFLFFAARTLRVASTHFVANLVDSRRYCSISDCEGIFQFLKIRKAFLLTGKVFASLTALVFFTLLNSACIGIVRMFKQGIKMESSIYLLVIAYYMWTMIAAADAATKLKYVTHMLNSPKLRLKDHPTESLQKHLVIYEIGSRSFGWSVSDVFTITYSLVGTVVVTFLSNATIVLQSFDFYAKANAPPPPPPPEE